MQKLRWLLVSIWADIEYSHITSYSPLQWVKSSSHSAAVNCQLFTASAAAASVTYCHLNMLTGSQCHQRDIVYPWAAMHDNKGDHFVITCTECFIFHFFPNKNKQQSRNSDDTHQFSVTINKIPQLSRSVRTLPGKKITYVQTVAKHAGTQLCGTWTCPVPVTCLPV